MCYGCVIDGGVVSVDVIGGVIVLPVLMSSVWCMVLFCTGAVLLMHHTYDVPDAVMIHHWWCVVGWISLDATTSGRYFHSWNIQEWK